VLAAPALLWARRRGIGHDVAKERARVRKLDRSTWRMPPLEALPAPRKTLLRTVSVYGLRLYVVIAVIIVGVKVFSPFIH
jgi:hypothetical protein